jgi:hypothetical protein
MALTSKLTLSGLPLFASDDLYRFTEMGFPADQVVDVLRHLNYRGSNKREVGEDAVIQRLCG